MGGGGGGDEAKGSRVSNRTVVCHLDTTPRAAEGIIVAGGDEATPTSEYGRMPCPVEGTGNVSDANSV